MDSIQIRKIQEWAAEEDKRLLASDPRLRGSVLVVHDEGSVFAFQNAFLVQVNDEWIVAFTEHQGFHVWLEEDLLWYAQFEKRSRKISNIKI